MKGAHTIPEAIDPHRVYPAGMERLSRLRQGAVGQPDEWFDNLGPEGAEAYLQMSMNAYVRVYVLGGIAATHEVAGRYSDENKTTQVMVCQSGALALGAASELTAGLTGRLFARTTMRVDEVQTTPRVPRQRGSKITSSEYRIANFGVILFRGNDPDRAVRIRETALSPYDYWHYDHMHYVEFLDTGDERYLPFKNFAGLNRLVDLLDALTSIEDRLVAERQATR